ncbi:MAG TPA: START-like domain-containing protein [Chitinophagales bacterium]|nr:START-like domain-containing protein [Chitinophagales bacterium]HNL83951.1 START-like domain-containing protein [Chitinophagales bacterium]
MAKKVPFTVERTFRSSPAILYSFLTTPSGLVQWFADYVDLDPNGEVFTFEWNGEEQNAEVLAYEEEEFVKLRWEDDDDDRAYFEYRIRVTDITKETILTVTDYAYKEDVESSKALWMSQLNDLAKALGNN